MRIFASVLKTILPVTYTCACCGYITLKEYPGDYDVCGICFWEDDPIQLLDPWYEGGANSISLFESQKNYSVWGAVEEKFLDYVRRPNFLDRKDKLWRAVEERDRRSVTRPYELQSDGKQGKNVWYYWMKQQLRR